MLKQLYFFGYAAGVTGQAAISPNNPVAWNDYGNRIVPYCAAYRLAGHIFLPIPTAILLAISP